LQHSAPCHFPQYKREHRLVRFLIQQPPGARYRYVIRSSFPQPVVQESDQKQLAGIVTLLARHGKVVEERTYGKKDIASGAPMTKDTIFRIFSMTKPVTGVAMMILYEEGKWQPSDPISKYIPEFAQLKVFKGVDQGGKILVEDPVHPPTMRELMTHTAGFTYGVFGNTAVDKMYLNQQVLRSQSLEGLRFQMFVRADQHWEASPRR
jgi:CubicO group peptidase (beta-lactamase class C family)